LAFLNERSRNVYEANKFKRTQYVHHEVTHSQTLLLILRMSSTSKSRETVTTTEQTKRAMKNYTPQDSSIKKIRKSCINGTQKVCEFIYKPIKLVEKDAVH
jgi:hypothetical protein